jgi:chemotaxis response regulator CheB
MGLPVVFVAANRRQAGAMKIRILGAGALDGVELPSAELAERLAR